MIYSGPHPSAAVKPRIWSRGLLTLESILFSFAFFNTFFSGAPVVERQQNAQLRKKETSLTNMQDFFSSCNALTFLIFIIQFGFGIKGVTCVSLIMGFVETPLKTL